MSPTDLRESGSHSYDRFIGRYSKPLAVALADAAGIEAGMRALDVGCGPGALTAELVARLGSEHVAAVDPSQTFVDACAQRNPDVDVRVAGRLSVVPRCALMLGWNQANRPLRRRPLWLHGVALSGSSRAVVCRSKSASQPLRYRQ